MRTIRYGIMALCISMGAVTPALARVDIDINLSLFPELVPVPGYPVYYAPQADLNYFFYDGMYWVYEDDGWYTSNWYDGPWEYVDPEEVPVYVLRVPVRYYRRPPTYFYGWRSDAPPRWGVYWGDDWSRHHNGWDHWDRRRVPKPAPLPTYQRNYSGDRYPRGPEQREIRDQNYRYQPHNAEARKHYQGSTDHLQRSNESARTPEQHDDRSNYQQQHPQQNTERHESPQRASPPAQTGGDREQRSDRDRSQQQQHLQDQQHHLQDQQHRQEQQQQLQRQQLQRQQQQPQQQPQQQQVRQLQPQQRPQQQQRQPTAVEQRPQRQEQEHNSPHNESSPAPGRGPNNDGDRGHGQGEGKGDRDK
jgi:hypothetical protein